MNLHLEESLPLQCDLPTRSAIERLMQSIGGFRVSFYLNTENSDGEYEKAAETLKKAYCRASYDLRQQGLFKVMIDSWLQPVRNFWENPQLLGDYPDGIAIFLSDEKSIVMKIPYPVVDRVWLSNRFYLKPLLPRLNDGGVIYILLLNLQNTQMLRRGVNSMEVVRVPNMPGSQYHLNGASPAWETEDEYASHAPPQEYDELNAQQRIERFNRQVASAVSLFLDEQESTLVVIGEEQNVEQFHNAVQQKEDHRIITHHANPDEFSETGLWEFCSGIAREIAQETLSKQIHELEKLSPSKLEKSVTDAASAATRGEIDLSIVCLEDEFIGTVDPQTEDYRILSGEHDVSDAHDLLDIIAQETTRHGGKAFAAPRETMPAQVSVLARRR